MQTKRLGTKTFWQLSTKAKKLFWSTYNNEWEIPNFALQTPKKELHALRKMPLKLIWGGVIKRAKIQYMYHFILLTSASKSMESPFSLPSCIPGLIDLV